MNWSRAIPLTVLLAAVFGAGGAAVGMRFGEVRIAALEVKTADLERRETATEKWCAVHQQMSDDAMREIHRRQDRDDAERMAHPPKWSP